MEANTNLSTALEMKQIPENNTTCFITYSTFSLLLLLLKRGEIIAKNNTH